MARAVNYQVAALYRLPLPIPQLPVSRPTTATIHTDALRHNLTKVRQTAPNSKVMAVVKADAYGHGLERVASALESADAFGVAAMSDAERIRAAGISQPILLLSGLDEVSDVARLAELQTDSVIHHVSQIEFLEEAQSVARPIDVWMKVDSGMHRLGFYTGDVPVMYGRLQALQGKGIVGKIRALNHFAASDELDSPVTQQQMDVFQNTVQGLQVERSLANSAAILSWPNSHCEWVRAGGALYGQTVVEGKTGADFGLRPAMTFSTRLIAVNQIKQGERVGYGGAYECPETMPVGVAAIGYGDGYPRAVKSGTPVMVNGQMTQIIGRVSMDLMTIDLRGIGGADVGSVVTLWGPELPVETIGAAAGTIGYELTCSITRRVRFQED